MTSTLSPADAVRASAAGSYYGLMYLAFATLAYTDEAASSIGNVKADLAALLAKQPPPPPPPGGTPLEGAWSLDWGPAVYDVDENLMYVVSFRETPEASPVLTILAIRGTDTTAGAAAIMGQLFEDVADWTRVNWKRAEGGSWECLPDLDPFDGSLPKIATGTCNGLRHLRGLTQVPASGGPSVTAEAYLQSLLQRDPSLPVIVTGHSLGGCQTTVMALHLAAVLPAGTNLYSHPFAPPTAGNSAFAELYDAQFGNGKGNVWWNTLDLVPSAFAEGNGTTPGSLSYAEGFWQNFTYSENGQTANGPGNVALRATIATLKHTLPEYTQPAAGSIRLNGSVASPAYLATWDATKASPATWESQLLWQHLPPNYYLLMTSQVPGLAPYPYPIPGDLPGGA